MPFLLSASPIVSGRTPPSNQPSSDDDDMFRLYDGDDDDDGDEVRPRKRAAFGSELAAENVERAYAAALDAIRARALPLILPRTLPPARDAWRVVLAAAALLVAAVHDEGLFRALSAQIAQIVGASWARPAADAAAVLALLDEMNETSRVWNEGARAQVARFGLD